MYLLNYDTIFLPENDGHTWELGQYSNLHTPQSPCISAQWTYRDGHLLNLPSSLLVEGDVILMRPGHAAPGQCISLSKVLLYLFFCIFINVKIFILLKYIL